MRGEGVNMKGERSMKSALVLGGGFAGLSAAVHLALAGEEVTLLEQAPSLGGKAGEYRENGYRFDIGPSVWTLPHIVTEFFERAGETPPVFTPLEPLCRYRFDSGRVWDVYRDVEKTAAQLSGEEAQVYRNLVAEARALYEAAAPTFLYNQAPGLTALARYGLQHGLRAHPLKRLPGLLESLGAQGDLKTFFLRFATYFGADPHRAPAVLHNIAWTELGLGAYYPEGGIRGVVNQLCALAKKLGVKVLTETKVERLETHANHLKHVHTSSGPFTADTVISSLDIIRTHQLLGRKTRVERLEPSLSGFVLLLGLKGETPGLTHHNILFPKDYRAEFEAVRRGALPRDPTLYVSISSKSQPNDAPRGGENWFVLVNAPAVSEEVRDDEADYVEHLIDLLERRGLEVRGRLEVQKIFPPRYLTTLAHRGSIYGAAPHSLLQTLRPKQTVRGVSNLFLAGGSVHPGGGIPLALLSGKHAAALALK